jgi:oxygen-independent coproporphyrinogen III oxidase
MTTTEVSATTEVGSYFISNYPPFSQWQSDFVPAAMEALNADPLQTANTPLGLYIHIPFCRKRCKFCYFRVYTNQNAKAIEDYVKALIQELELISQRSAIGTVICCSFILVAVHPAISAPNSCGHCAIA